MSAALRPLLHVGFPKTGSTWLQDRLFDDPECGFRVPFQDARARLIAEFVVADAYRFDAEAARAVFSDGLAEAAREGRVPVLSDETLCGDPLQRRYDGCSVADRLAATFPEARVLICVREQRSALASLYREYVRHGGIHTPRQFLGTGSEGRSFTPICRLDYLEYQRPVAHYRALFGHANVLVLPFEWLARDQRDFAQRIVDFAGSRGRVPGESPASNPGWSAATLPVARWLNQLSPRDPLSARQSLGHRASRRLAAQLDRALPRSLHERAALRRRRAIEARVGRHYAEPNRELAALVDADLGELGYDVADEPSASAQG